MYGGSLGQISNKATWTNGFEVVDAQTDDLMDLTGATVTMKVIRSPCGSTTLSGSTTTGELAIPALGLIDFRFEASQMASLCGGTYEASVLIERGNDTDQIFLGTIAVQEAP
jgi:hypothetical protein